MEAAKPTLSRHQVIAQYSYRLYLPKTLAKMYGSKAFFKKFMDLFDPKSFIPTTSARDYTKTK